MARYGYKDLPQAALSKKAGYVFQNPDDQIFHNTVEKEIRFGPEVLKMSEGKVKEMTEYSASLTGLTGEMEENPYNLPLSVRKFVTIASIIAMDTDIIILDEPTAGQDIKGIRLLENMLKELTARGKTIVTITHDMEFVVNNFHKVFVMAHKNLLKITNPKEVFSDDKLLEESMLMKPYISELVSELGITEQITSRTEFANYIKLIHDSNILTALKNTLIYGIGSTIIQNILGLSYAILLNTRIKGRTIIRTVVYAPVMISGLVMGYIMYFLVQYDGGAINDIMAAFGQAPVDWLSSGSRAVIIMTLINSIQYVGISMVIYLAGLQNISSQYYEAAAIDGVSRWQQFRYITVPLLIPAISSSVNLKSHRRAEVV